VLRLDSGVELNPRLRLDIRLALERWHEAHPLDVPWRQTTDPYRVLIAEMLLQRTRYERVSGVIADLLRRYDTPSSLSECDESVLAATIRPLGLANRAAVLKACASELVSRFNGAVPESEENLISLPGVGNYVARAVRCICFAAEGNALDSAIGRMLNRLVGREGVKEAGYDRELWSVASWFAQETRKEYFFGLLDVSREICKPRPACHLCPVNEYCAAA
jgi:A/G-specific adenine glycosylase